MEPGRRLVEITDFREGERHRARRDRGTRVRSRELAPRIDDLREPTLLPPDRELLDGAEGQGFGETRRGPHLERLDRKRLGFDQVALQRGQHRLEDERHAAGMAVLGCLEQLHHLGRAGAHGVTVVQAEAVERRHHLHVRQAGGVAEVERRLAVSS